ncbi:transcription elongation factor TFIIS-like [Salvia divinorum]|uniref:Transcription elongation factor n=1 Tax=Salvia divinorum TaxID=28513 RepID=A0ABD1GD60_SALDI
MEKELTELFEAVKRAADGAEKSPAEEGRCLDALKQLKKFPVNYQLLISTQVGKRLRQLTKHKSDKIKALASDVVEIWKGIIVKETMKNKKNGNSENGNSSKTESRSETDEAKNFQRTNSMISENSPAPKKLKVDNSDKSTKSGSSSSVKIEKVEVQKFSSSVQKPPPKLSSPVSCKDSVRDKVREILADALYKVSSEADSDLKQSIDQHDPNRVAVQVETTMFEKWGKSNGQHKFKYRSVMFNIKDQNNPDFRRKVLTGEFSPPEILELTPEQMASDARQMENEVIKQKALFNSERAAAPKASTNEFRCGRCKKKECTYYQMQTRSADEPMTTFVTCVNCNNHWKFC